MNLNKMCTGAILECFAFLMIQICFVLKTSDEWQSCRATFCSLFCMIFHHVVFNLNLDTNGSWSMGSNFNRCINAVHKIGEKSKHFIDHLISPIPVHAQKIYKLICRFQFIFILKISYYEHLIIFTYVPRLNE